MAACAAGVVTALVCPIVHGGTVTYIDTADQGLWSTASSWSPSGVPAAQSDVFLGNHTASVSNLNVTYNYNSSQQGYYLNSVTLNSSNLSGYMILNQTVSTSVMFANTINIGTTTADNIYNQTAGLNYGENMNVGNGSTANYYNVSGTAIAYPSSLNVGVSGSGTVNQNGGTVDTTLEEGQENVVLGYNSGSTGTYTISAGSLTTGSLLIGSGGSGVFTQTGGTVMGYLTGGFGSSTAYVGGGGTGVYTLSGSGSMTFSAMYVGYGGTGTFNMLGGTATVAELNVGTNTSSGTFNLSGGTPSINVLYLGGGTGTGVVNLSGTGSLTSGVEIGTGGTFNLLPGGSFGGGIGMTAGAFEMEGGTFAYPPDLELGGGTFYLNGYSTTLSGLEGTGGAIETSGNGTTVLNISGGSTANFGGEITNGTGTLALVVSGANTMQELSGIGTYTGPTTITAGGTLEAGGNFGISPSSAVTINSGSTLNVNGFNVTILSLTGTGGTVAVPTGSLSTGGIGVGNSTTYSGAFTGAGSVIKTGSGILTLAGTSSGSFGGTFNVSAGALANGAVNGIPTASTVSLAYGVTLALSYNQTLAEVYGSLSTINFSNGSILTVGADNGNSSFEGFLNGSGTFIKVGTGEFTLGAGTNDSFAPNTNTTLGFNVSAGTLLLNKADGSNSIGGPLNILGGTVLYAQGDQIADTSTVTINSGTYNLAGFNESIGGLTGTGGNMTLGGGTLTVNQSLTTTSAAALSGLGTFTKSGTGSLTLTNASAFAGSFNANAGQLILSGPVNATGLTANSGGTLELLNSTLTLNNGAIQSNTGGAVQYSNTTIKNGYLLGGGVQTILNSGTTTFDSISTFNSVILNQNGPAVFYLFTGGGTLTSNAKLTLSEAVISSSGIFSANNSVTLLDFTNNGVMNINNGGAIANTGGNIFLGGGSRTYVNTGGSLTAVAGTTTELNGALLVNNGTVSGVVDVNFGSLATGTGNYSSAVNVNPGGTYAPGAYAAATVLPNTSSTTALIQPAQNGVTTITSAPVAVNAAAIVTVNGTDTLGLTGGLTASGYSVLKTGTGTVQVAPFSATSLNVSSGKVQLPANQTVSVLQLGTLTVQSAATLDLGNSAADISSGSLATLSTLAASGFANGTWAGTGISSSSAAANSAHLTALGVIQNNQGGTPLFSASKLFEGTTPGPSDILVKYTYYGDANLSGKVDGSDYSLIDSAYLADRSNSSAYTGWYNGDFNYDGVINGSDYTLIDNAFNMQGSQFTASIAGPNAQTTSEIANTATIAAVPEPTSLAVLCFATAGFLGRRRAHLD